MGLFTDWSPPKIDRLLKSGSSSLSRARRCPALQATGLAPDDGGGQESALRGLLLIGDLELDPQGRRLPWPLPPIGFGNAAHLATTAVTGNRAP